MREIIEVVDGPIAINRCLLEKRELQPEPCRQMRGEHRACGRAEGLTDALEAITIEKLLFDKQKMEQAS